MTCTHDDTTHTDRGDRAYIACDLCGLLLDDIGPAGTVYYEIADIVPAPADTYDPAFRCGCTASSRCPEANGLWAAANAIYYASGFDAWLKALEPFNEHNERVKEVR